MIALWIRVWCRAPSVATHSHPAPWLTINHIFLLQFEHMHDRPHEWSVEIDATILLKKTTGRQPGEMPNIGEMVTWVAELGGYTGKSSGGPPGAIVIARGLERIQPVVEVLRDGKM